MWNISIPLVSCRLSMIFHEFDMEVEPKTGGVASTTGKTWLPGGAPPAKSCGLHEPPIARSATTVCYVLCRDDVETAEDGEDGEGEMDLFENGDFTWFHNNHKGTKGTQWGYHGIYQRLHLILYTTSCYVGVWWNWKWRMPQNVLGAMMIKHYKFRNFMYIYI